MKAKDTVMSREQKLEHYSPRVDKWVGGRIDKLLQEQAEISFKAGIKEIVDWMNQYCEETYSHNDRDNFYHIKIHSKEWQTP